jgi:formiminoglutamate deiminase
VLITVEGDTISAVAPETQCPQDADRLVGLTLPGFANTHSHVFHRALRGRTHTGKGSFWTWREEMYRMAAGLDPDSYHALAATTYAEMRAAGYTVVGEFHYLHHSPGGRPYADGNAMSEALVAAAADADVRITLLDTLYLHGGIGTGGRYEELEPVQRRFSDGSAEAWAARVDAFRPTAARVGAAIHSVRAVDPRAMEVVRSWGDAHDAPLHIHLSEQPAENERCVAAHGTTPTGLLADIGGLGERTTVVHATHLTAGDITSLGTSHTTVCLCPTTERDLADGIGPSRRLVAAGARLAVGSDSQAVIDPFEEMRAVEHHQRLATLRRGNHSTTALLEAGTVDGYRALGWHAGGRIEPGRLADLITVEVEPGADPPHMLASAVFGRTRVVSVLVGGR